MNFSTFTTFVPTLFLFGMIGLHAFSESIKRLLRTPGSPLRISDFALPTACPMQSVSVARLRTVITLLGSMIDNAGLNGQPMTRDEILNDVTTFARRQPDSALTLAVLMGMADMIRTHSQAYWILRGALAREQAQRYCFANNLDFLT